MAGEATGVLAQFAASLSYDDLPRSVREHCKDLLLDALACALAGHQGEETHQMAALAGALAQSSEASVIGGGRLSLAGATLLNGYLITATTMCDVHRATMTHVTPEVVPPALAIAERERQLRPRPPGRHRRRLRGDDADRQRDRLSGIPQARLARAGRVRAVRRRRGGRPAARLRRRHHGARLRARRQPGRRHLRGLGHADGEIPPVPRRALRPDGGAAGGAEVRGDARIPHRQGRRPVQHLCQRRTARPRHRRSRQALGARADRAAAVAVGVADAGHEHRPVRDPGEARRSIRPRSRPCA